MYTHTTTYKFRRCAHYNIYIFIQSARNSSERVCARASLPVIYLHNIIHASTHLLHARRFMAKLIDLFRFLMVYARALRRTRHVYIQYYKYIIIEAANGYEHNLEKRLSPPLPPSLIFTRPTKNEISNWRQPRKRKKKTVLRQRHFDSGNVRLNAV